MTTAAIKAKLHDYIEEADDKKLEFIYSLFEDKSAPAVNWWEDKEVVAELDDRVARYKQGIDQGRTWDDVERSINELKKKRSEKNA